MKSKVYNIYLFLRYITFEPAIALLEVNLINILAHMQNTFSCCVSNTFKYSLVGARLNEIFQTEKYYL